ncbi:MAG: FecCD family ABC transporter permease [Microbacterium gubbeenense]|uniref:FecCD family ABC transporter permease n=1 Tax=Microbacterium gubbeenense TaxID=159896 RepID=UPI003F9E3072
MTTASFLPGRLVRVGRATFRIHPRTVVVLCVLAAVFLVTGVLSLMLGSISLSLADLWDVATGDARPAYARSVLGRKLPRLLTAALVGLCLGMSGAIVQSLTRNPLGSPDIVGFTTGAATAAVMQIVIFGGGPLATGIAAMLGGIGTAIVVYLLARRDGASGGLRLVLVGIGTGSLLGAVTSLVTIRASLDDATTVQLWTAGSLTGRGWPHVIALALAAIVLIPPLVVLAKSTTLIEMGDDTAQAIGIPVERIRFLALLVAVALAGVATGAAGPIAFIAFAAPHVARILVRTPGVLLWTSGIAGAALLAAADLLAQHVDISLRTPVGLVTSLLGGIYLLWLLARRL